jgi:DNA-binding transcriptional MocR family regulator
MEEILKIAKEHNLYVVEDNAQAIGADFIFSDGTSKNQVQWELLEQRHSSLQKI